MFEKVNPCHPDKVADRIAGAIVDLAYSVNDNPKIAVEVLLGHGMCNVIIETDTQISMVEIDKCVHRIAGENIVPNVHVVSQDKHLNDNQSEGFKCGDNGIFKGMPRTDEEKRLSDIARDIYNEFPTDGKYIIDGDRIIICQSCADSNYLKLKFNTNEVNPIGDWVGGSDVDSGATNRKLGSDMGRSVTGGGLHGKDLSKADVTLNIYAFLMAQETQEPVELCCAIGDDTIDGVPYSELVELARNYINAVGGFEKFAEWGLV